MSRPKVFLATAPNPGAVALLYVTGERAVEIACRAAGRRGLPDGRAVLARFGEIDEGLVQNLSSSVQRPASSVGKSLGVGYEKSGGEKNTLTPALPLRGRGSEGADMATGGGPHPGPLPRGAGVRAEHPHPGPPFEGEGVLRKTAIEEESSRAVESGAGEGNQKRKEHPHPSPPPEGEGVREECVLLMPHAGPRVVQRLIEYLVQLGAQYDGAPDPAVIYPEAQSRLEAQMLWTLAHCPSPGAVDLLLDQPGLWAEALREGLVEDAVWRAGVVARSRGVMRRWLSPGSVVIAGVPNVGKSTLTNRVLGRSASIVADEPGTTRDWVGGMAVLGGAAVRWLDTPGVRATEDLVERQAIEMARGVIQSADVLVAMNEPGGPWPVLEGVMRRPDLYVTNKVEEQRAGTGDGSIGRPLRMSAASGEGVDAFLNLVAERLGVGAGGGGCWAFCEALEGMLERGDVEGVRGMLDAYQRG